jgi:hypothetical protein
MEPTEKKPLDQVRACPELAEGTPSASRAVAGQCKHYSIRTACHESAEGVTDRVIMGHAEPPGVGHLWAPGVGQVESPGVYHSSSPGMGHA